MVILRLLSIAVAVGSIGILHVLAYTWQAASGSWKPEPAMPVGRSAHAVAATAEAIYVLGGTNETGVPVLEVDRFDGSAWSREGRIPGEGLNAPAAVSVGDAIYLIGGFGTTTNRPTASVHRYNVKQRAWTTAAALPAPRGGHAAAVLGGRVHVIGGGNSVSTIADHSVYDPATDTWAAKAPLPRSMGSPAAAVLDDRLYSIGGRSGPGDFGDVHIYDPAKDTWTPGPAIAPRGTAGAAVLNGVLYVFGGESQARKAVLGEVLRMDRGATGWTADAAMPTPRNFARAVVLKGVVYTVGGSVSAGSSHASAGSAVVESFR